MGCNTCQHYKRSTIKCGVLTAKLVEETPRNKLCVDLIGLYNIHRKGKCPQIFKSVKIIYPVTWWFEVAKYSHKKAMTISNFVETKWLVQYPCPVEIMYDRGGYLLGHEFKHIFIANEYG